MLRKKNTLGNSDSLMPLRALARRILRRCAEPDSLRRAVATGNLKQALEGADDGRLANFLGE